jgi:hypothetical protein
MTSRYSISQYNTIQENKYFLNLTSVVIGFQYGVIRVELLVVFVVNECQGNAEKKNAIMNGICESEI